MRTFLLLILYILKMFDHNFQFKEMILIFKNYLEKSCIGCMIYFSKVDCMYFYEIIRICNLSQNFIFKEFVDIIPIKPRNFMNNTLLGKSIVCVEEMICA